MITGSELLESLVELEALGDIGRLLLDTDHHVAGLVVETLVGVIVADVFDRAADDALVVQLGLGGDLTQDHDHARLRGGFTGHLGGGILPQAGIENRIRYLIADLVWMTFTDRFGGEEEVVGSFGTIGAVDVLIDHYEGLVSASSAKKKGKRW